VLRLENVKKYTILCVINLDLLLSVSVESKISAEILVLADIRFWQCTEMLAFGRNSNSCFGRSLIRILFSSVSCELTGLSLTKNSFPS
jgi:hypothetical protein